MSDCIAIIGFRCSLLACLISYIPYGIEIKPFRCIVIQLSNEVVSTYFLLTVAGFFAGDSVNRRSSDLSVGADESGGSGAKDPQMLIKERKTLHI